jgi:hypothetical protein
MHTLRLYLTPIDADMKMNMQETDYDQFMANEVRAVWR